MPKTPFRFPLFALVTGLMIICLTGCDLDENASFLEETRAGYLLYEKQNGAKSIFFISNSTTLSSWNESISLRDPEVSDIAGFQKELWIASANRNSVIEIDVLKGEISRSISLPDFQPDFIGVGDKMVLIADSSKNEVVFLDKGKEDIFRISIPDKGSRIAYKSRKFYLQSGPSTVIILSEDALAEITRLQLERPIKEIQVDASVSIIVSTMDSSLYQATLNFNTNSFTQREISVAYQKIRFSPYTRQLYGKEQLQTFSLTDNTLQPANLQNLTDFEADFFENHLWVMRNDSLFQVFEDKTFSFQSLCEGCSLLKSYFFQDFVGD